MSELTLDFSRIKGPVYTGRGRGEALRRKFELDEKEDALEAVAVIIPDSTYTVSSSFFLGLFGPSVVKAGSVAQFKRKFHFRAPTVLESVLDAHAARALQGHTLIPQ
jgi:hypothetical protein